MQYLIQREFSRETPRRLFSFFARLAVETLSPHKAHTYILQRAMEGHSPEKSSYYFAPGVHRFKVGLDLDLCATGII
jgi:hypothetical protein